MFPLPDQHKLDDPATRAWNGGPAALRSGSAVSARRVRGRWRGHASGAEPGAEIVQRAPRRYTGRGIMLAPTKKGSDHGQVGDAVPGGADPRHGRIHLAHLELV